MIPLRLELRNFLSYGEDHEPLSLEGIHVACLSGPNGNGKSALLDAMIWALWGEARGGDRAGDDLIRQGAHEMLVSLEFELDSVRYRVTRRRTKQGKLGRGELSLESLDGGDWRTLTGGSIAQTQNSINNLLRMTHKTFTHASFIAQGAADAFMTLPPRDRKQVLGEILDLQHYDDLSQRARDLSRVARTEGIRLSGLIEGIDAQLAKRDVYLEELKSTESNATEATALKDRLEDERRGLLTEVEALAEAERQAVTKERQSRDAEDQVSRLRGQMEDLDRRILDADAVALRAPAIEQEHEEYQRSDEEDRELSSRFDAWSAARDSLAEAQTAIHRERMSIEARLESVTRQAREIEGRLDDPATLDTEIERRGMELARLDEVNNDLNAVRSELEEANKRREVLLEDGKRLHSNVEDVTKRIEMLGENQDCPLCGQPLGEEGLSAARARLAAEREQFEDQLRAARSSYASEDTRVKAAQATIANRQAELVARSGVEQALGELTSRRARVDQDRGHLADIRQEETELSRVLADEDFASDVRGRLPALEERVRNVGYDPEHHKAVRDTRFRLREAPEAMQRLNQARTARENAAVDRVRIEASLAAAQTESASLAKERAEFARVAGDLPRARAALDIKGQELQSAAKTQLAAKERLGRARQMVTWLDQQEVERREFDAQRLAARQDTSAYDQLAEAFGRNGIQEMIVEHALPEIEDSANDLLGRLTDGKMRLQLNTQRASRTGGPISTLDVVVSDELGSRPYELFSGGEKFRISFAIRIALSQLLARRAGAPLQMLAIDEGFGSQDRDGCDRLVEAIKAIQDDFKRILVITHLDDMKDAFPVRIEVTKTHLGSAFTIT
ncbi:MAG: hypothetical protein HW416_66 [Chloroflexi bacterium]|nr:hypothetical protein [Chloroflexota bacterium]